MADDAAEVVVEGDEEVWSLIFYFKRLDFIQLRLLILHCKGCFVRIFYLFILSSHICETTVVKSLVHVLEMQLEALPSKANLLILSCSSQLELTSQPILVEG